jgi:DNA polymerase-3 subunit beta
VSSFELVISRSELARILSGAASIASKKSPIHVLKAALLEATDGNLNVRATDHYLGIEENAPCRVKTTGRVAVDAAKLFELCRSLPEGDVSLKESANQLELKAGKAKLKLPTIAANGGSADDFPTLPKAADAKPVITVESGELIRAIKQGGYAMMVEDNRPSLGGTLFESSGGDLTLVSTDGKRLATSTIVGTASKVHLLVPMKGVTEARKMAEANKGKTVEIRATESTVFFCANGTSLSVKLIDQPFPPWRKVVPTSHKQRVTVDRDTLSSVIKRISLVADNHDGGCVCLGLSEGILRVSGAGQGEGEEDIECDATKDVRIHVNPTLFSQAVDAVPDDSVVLELGGDLDPILVKGADSSEAFGVVMPRRGV